MSHRCGSSKVLDGIWLDKCRASCSAVCVCERRRVLLKSLLQMTLYCVSKLEKSMYIPMVCPQELQPWFHNKAFGNGVGSRYSHLLAPCSFPFWRAQAPQLCVL